MASHLLPLTLSVTVVIDVRHAYIITLPALFINPSDYLTVTSLYLKAGGFHRFLFLVPGQAGAHHVSFHNLFSPLDAVSIFSSFFPA